ncbi:10839_t:CDS:2 [Dentiscutata erythropus]|uniref:GTP cyclohydrolase II n=1 Tax=Dentiscutata erythropus TaxID=1348616 RepID=A0A9N9DNI2_9GLOM|nr:10839_t:CDS:2 [Dentiscutata erythropus]
MGRHSIEEAIFVQPVDVSTFNTSLTSDKTATTTTLTKSTLPISNNVVTSMKRSAVLKKSYTNGITTNHNIRFSLKAPETIITPPATPPSSYFTNNKIQLSVECLVRARIPTSTGEVFLHVYRNNKDGKEHLAAVYGDEFRSKSLDTSRSGESEMDRIVRGAYTGKLRPGQTRSNDSNISIVYSKQLPPPLVRIHSECFTGETLKSARCDCGEQLEEAMRLIQAEGRGVVIYLRQEGRGIGLADKLRAYNLQDLGHDTVTANILLNHPPDLRTYDIASLILADLGLTSIRLLTNNPDKIEQIENDGVKVVERIPMVPRAWKGKLDSNRIGHEMDQYLKVKVERMRHLLNIPESLLP